MMPARLMRCLLLAIPLVPVAAAQFIPPPRPRPPEPIPAIASERLENGVALFVWPDDATLTSGVSIWIAAAARHAPPELPTLTDALCRRLAARAQAECHAEPDGLLLTLSASDLPAVVDALQRFKTILTLEPSALAGEPTEGELKSLTADEDAKTESAITVAFRSRVPPTAWKTLIEPLLTGSDYVGALAKGHAATDADTWSVDLATEFIQAQLVTANVRVLVRGPFEPAAVIAAARRTLGSLSRQSPPEDAPDPVRERETLPLRAIEVTTRSAPTENPGSTRANLLLAWELLPIGFFENAGSDALAHWLTNPVDGALREYAVAVERLAFQEVGLLVLWLRAIEPDTAPDALLEAVNTALRRAADEQFDPLPLERARQLALRDAYAPTHAGLPRDVRAARRVLLSGDPQAATRWIPRLKRNDASRLARAAEDLLRARRAAVAWQAPDGPTPRSNHHHPTSTPAIESAAQQQLRALEQHAETHAVEPIELPDGRTLTLQVHHDPQVAAAQVWLLRPHQPPTPTLPEALAEAGVSVPDLADLLSYNAAGVATLTPEAKNEPSGWYGWGPPDAAELLLSELFIRALPGIPDGGDRADLRLVVAGVVPADTFRRVLAELLAAARPNAAAE